MKNLFVFAAISAVTFYSCEKEKVAETAPNETNSNVQAKTTDVIGDYEENMLNCVDNDTVKYYLDNEIVEPGTYDPANEELHLFVDGNETDAYVNIRAFTTKDLMLEYGDDNDIPLRTLDDFETELTNYINDNGIIEAYESDRVLSEDFIAYQNALIDRYFPGAADDRGAITLHKDYIGGASWIHGSASAILVPGYNNTVSRHFDFSIYGFVNVYDRTFYRRKMVTLWAWGWSNIWYHQSWGLAFLNNRMSSQINL